MSGEIPPAVGDFPPGARIASYQVEQLIGRGGMATVYRATDVRLGRPVALKVLAAQLARDEAFRQRFIRESRSAASVDHPNVIPVFEAGEADGVLFIAMRYVTGFDVRALIERQGKLPPARVVNIVTQVASALDAAHAHGLIHRDVKPANMLLATVGTATSPDHVYLSDFGLSKLSVSTQSLTGTGQFLGTIDYMSPEQVEGRPVDGRTDLYALGCAAFEMLTGEPPFRREQNLAVMWAQVAAPPPSARSLRPELPAEVDQVIAKALAKSPTDRQSTCMEFAAELRAACALRGREGQPGGAPPQRPPTELAFGPGAGAAMGAAAGAGIAAAGGMPPVAPVARGFEDTVTEGAGPVTGSPAGPGPATGSPAGAGQPTGPSAAPGLTRQDPPGQGFPGQGFPGQGFPGAPGSAGGWSGQPPASGTDQLWQGPAPAGYQAPPPPRRTSRLVPFLAGLLLVLILAGAGYAVLRLHESASSNAGPHTGGTATVTVTPSSPSGSASPSGSGSPSASQSASPSASATPTAPSGPSAVVTDYYNAINAHHYRLAWNINQSAHSLSTYPQFRHGYVSTTRSVALTIVSVSGDQVSVNLAATQLDGTIKYYTGSYTVQSGTIVASSIQPAG